MKNIRNVIKLLAFNWRPLVTFEIFYKVITAALVVPGFNYLLTFILEITDFHYITAENYKKFFQHPITIGMLILLLILITLYSLIDLGTVIYILDQSAQGHKTTVRVSFRYSLRKSFRMLLPQNLPMIFVVVFMIPFLHLGFISSLIGTLSLPDFITEDVWGDPLYRGILIAVIVLLGYVLLRWIYIFHYYELEKCNFFTGVKKSAHLGRKHRIVDLICIALTQGFLSLVYFGTSFLGVAIITLGKKLCDSLGMTGVVLSSIVVLFLGVMLVVFLALSLPLSFATISALFYYRKEQKEEEIHHTRKIERKGSKAWIRISHTFWALVLVAALVICGVSLYRTYHGEYSLDIEHVHQMEVTAHRGASSKYPENTMIAFGAAFQQGADWIELDIQQSKDGVIFVMHDSNFKRTTGVNKKPWQLTWEEIQKLDAGSYKSEEFAGEKIPSLEEVIIFAKTVGIRLNIELKPTGHEVDFEEGVVAMLDEYDFVDQCVVTSQNYACVKKVKELNPDIRTVYVMSVAVGDLDALSAADDFSIRSSFINQNLVDTLHNKGHKVYAWTVNKPEAIDRMINMNVDNIITNYVPVAKDCIAKSRVTNLVDDLIAFLQQL